MRVGARFGEPCFYPFVTGMDGYPHIFEVVKAENEGTNFGGNWHSDTTYLEQPPLATLLYAVETPSRGGDTLFTSTRAAYDALSESMRRLVDGLVGVNSAGLKHRWRTKCDAQEDRRHESPRYRQRRPVRGRASRGAHASRDRPQGAVRQRSHTIRFKDMSEDESRPLIEWLQAHQTRPEFTCRVRWAPGTLTIWDNRCTQHNAINDYHGQRRRIAAAHGRSAGTAVGLPLHQSSFAPLCLTSFAHWRGRQA